MRVLQILPYYRPAHRYGGPVESVHGLNKALAQAGMDVTLFTTNIDGLQNLNVPLGEAVLIDDVKVYYYPVQQPRSYIFSSKFKQALDDRLKTFDIVHIHGLYVYPTAVTARLCRDYHIPYVIAPRGMLTEHAINDGNLLKRGRKRTYLRFIEQANLDGAAALHFTTEEERIRSFYDCELDRSFIIPNTLDITAYPLRSGQKEDIATDTILFLGRIHPIKALDLLIPAFAKVIEQHPHARLHLVGPDNVGYFADVQQLIDYYQLQAYVHYDDMLLGEQKIKAMQDAALFVLPSYTENFGNVVIEALACETAVVISDRVNIHPEIQKSDAGLVVRCDVDELANGILELLNDPERTVEMGKRGRKLVEDRFSLESVAQQMITAYQTILSKAQSSI